MVGYFDDEKDYQGGAEIIILLLHQVKIDVYSQLTTASLSLDSSVHRCLGGTLESQK